MLKQILYFIKRPYHFIKTGLLKGIPAQIKYRFPAKKLKIIIITGTDGKTTSSTLLYHVLKTADKKVGLISTVTAYIGNQTIDTGLHVTAPTPKKMQHFMAKMVKKKSEYLVLEFTSHGAYQHRNWGIKPIITGLTNINYEHLDYHLDYNKYVAAKALLFKKTPTAVLNKDDPSFSKIKKYLNKKKQAIVSYSAEDKLSKKLHEAVNQRFPEKYNQMNARLVIAIAKQLKIKDKIIVHAIETFDGIPGRMQVVANKRGLNVVIDFAHTPQALEAALKALCQQMRGKRGKLIAVFGCAGLRDKMKRSMMGKIAVNLADIVVMTAEDPRKEDVWSIIRQMKEQLTEGHNKIISIADRRQAINFAINKLAKKGDTIGIFGKGPEKSMCYGTTETPWSDKKAVLEALAKIN